MIFMLFRLQVFSIGQEQKITIFTSNLRYQTLKKPRPSNNNFHNPIKSLTNIFVEVILFLFFIKDLFYCNIVD
jgi:hypothetical protein